MTKLFLRGVCCGNIMGNVQRGENRAAAGVQLCKVLIKEQVNTSKERAGAYGGGGE